MYEDDTIGRSRMLPPLPERMRPHDLDGYFGQKHLIGKGGIIRNMIENGNLSSFILWGPPGVGKTTLSHIVAKSLGREFFTLSAVSAGVKDVRDVIDRARSNSLFSGGLSPILFIDEIHRFNKSQQDALLGAVEDGTIVLIGATTENPSFEVITPLLSRCQVFVLKSLEAADLQLLLLGVGGHLDDLHAVQQRSGNRIQGIGSGDEHHIGKVNGNFQIVIPIGVVLFSVQHFQQCRTGIATIVGTHLINFIQ